MKAAYKEREIVNLISAVFEIDEQGRIWKIARKNNNGSGTYIPIKRKRAESLHSEGYLRIRFINKKYYYVFAHRLVWQYFFGDIPEGLEINHKNGIKTDNRPKNLEMITHKENIHHAVKIGLHVNKGEDCGMTKLTEQEVLEIREKYISRIYTQSILAREYGVDQTNIGYIVRRETWKHI